MAPLPAWLTFVPSDRHPGLVREFAEALASHLSIPAIDAIQKTRATEPQSSMHNSTTQVRNIWQAFEVGPVPAGSCLLVDDVIDSRWTVAVTSHLLRQAGCDAVIPIALAAARG